MSTVAYNIHPKLIKCKICSKESSVTDINVTKHEELNGCDIIKCNKCHSVWYICKIHNNRFSISNKSKMVKHFTLLHSQPEIKKKQSIMFTKRIKQCKQCRCRISCIKWKYFFVAWRLWPYTNSVSTTISKQLYLRPF